MINLQKYDEFVNEGKTNEFFKNIKFNLKITFVRSIFKLMKILSVFSLKYSNVIMSGEISFNKMVSF
jgi:hypothetical protein